MAALLTAPAVGSAQRFGGSGSGARDAAQTPPQTQGRAQTTPAPPGTGQPNQRPQPSAERFLGGGTWWKDEAVKKEMQLTESQVRAINQIFDSRLKYVTPFYDDYRKQLAELDRLTLERTVDIPTFEIQVGRTEAARAKVNETRTVMLYRFYKLLDPKQHQKLQEIRDRGGRGGRGGGGGPMPRTW